MELKPGYKQTEVGVIPEDWVVASVGEKGQVVAGKALAVNAPGKQRPYLRTKNVFDGRIDIEDVLSMPMTDEQFSQFQLRHGDVLLNEGQSLELVGRCSIYKEEYPEPCAIQNALLRFRADTGTSASFASHLFRHCQQTGVFAKIALQTTSVAHLGSSRFANLKLAWPTENEQRLIAAALDELDVLLSSLEAAITKKTSLKQAAMQELLTGKRRLPGFEGEWEVKRLGDVLSICHGKSQRDVEVTNGPYPILATGGQIGTAARPLYSKPSVLIGRKGTINKPQYMDTPFWTVDTLFYSAMKEGNSARFFYYLFCTIDWMQFNEASGVPSLNAKTIETIEAGCPVTQEQDAIASVLSGLDAELAALEARKDKAQQLKQGMMQQLLTGNIRLR